ncbi:CoA transferase [Trujillonella endophytica]|uniref:CoA-transferase family III n=1 Tax=Trujillonella endophytica TaxID=673521 RepID=A0A1H8V555_9ACTN|nr:CoA transferase [Trujillella endophytica]SEP10610.1 CoA-transferase family III [Trujillella endophytica]
MPRPLAGLRVLELQGRGPGPFGTMVLADLGAEVLAVGRVADVAPGGSESTFGRAEIDALLATGAVVQDARPLPARN